MLNNQNEQERTYMSFHKLDVFLNELIGDKIPGLSVVITEGNNEIYNKNFGFFENEEKLPMTGDEIFNFYSMTKPVTCVAALQLFEKGKFLLDDPICKYIPEFEKVYIKKENGEMVLSDTPVSIKDLFCMTSGYDYNLQSEELNSLREKNDRMPTMEVVKALAKTPLVFKPGTRWQYGLSHDILAGLVEVISGQKYSEYVRDNIFKPLGMNASGFHQHEVKKDISPQYEFNYDIGKCEKIDTSCMYRLGGEHDSGGAGLISCIKDYSLFAQALANGGAGRNGARILSRNTVELMSKNHLTDEQLKTIVWPEMNGYGYGLGVRVLMDSAAAGTIVPEGEFGWNGAAGGFLLIDLKRKLSVVATQHILNEYCGIDRQLKLKNVIYSCLD